MKKPNGLERTPTHPTKRPGRVTGGEIFGQMQPAGIQGRGIGLHGIGHQTIFAEAVYCHRPSHCIAHEYPFESLGIEPQVVQSHQHIATGHARARRRTLWCNPFHAQAFRNGAHPQPQARTPAATGGKPYPPVSRASRAQAQCSSTPKSASNSATGNSSRP